MEPHRTLTPLAALPTAAGYRGSSRGSRPGQLHPVSVRDHFVNSLDFLGSFCLSRRLRRSALVSKVSSVAVQVKISRSKLSLAMILALSLSPVVRYSLLDPALPPAKASRRLICESCPPWS